MSKSPDTNKVKRTSLSIEDRSKIIERIKAGESMNTVALEYNVTRQAISKIKNAETKILQMKNQLVSCEGNLMMKKYKGVEDSILDRKVYEWFKQRRSMGFAVSGTILKKKALFFHNRLGSKDNFIASDGWLTRFKKRHGIKEKIIHGEKLSANVEGSEIFKAKMTNIRQVTGIDLKYLYNCDESALYWKMMPMRTLVCREEKQSNWRKKPKNRVTILFCVNASGTHKIPLFVIGKYAKPRCFKNVNHLPVPYVSQKNAWMTCDLIKLWYRSVFLPDVKKEHDLDNNPNIKIILIMDNAACHPPAEEMNQMCSSCSVLYLPPNVTALIQPLNQGIIEKFKRSYRYVLLERVLAEEKLHRVEDYSKSLDLIDCFNYCQMAWISVSQNDIRNCWKNIIPLENDVPTIQSFEVPEFQALLKKIQQLNYLSANEINNWLDIDADDFGWQTLSDEDILLSRQPNNQANDAVEELDDEIQYMDLPSIPTDSILDNASPTFIEALSGFRLFLQWYQKNGENSDELQQPLQQLHHNLLKKLISDK